MHRHPRRRWTPNEPGVPGLRRHAGRHSNRSGMMVNIVEPLFELFYVFVGTIAAAFYTRDSPSAMRRIQALFPNRDQVFYNRLDFALVVAIGTILAYATGPRDQAHAIGAGVGAVAVLRQLMTSKAPSRQKGRQ